MRLKPFSLIVCCTLLLTGCTPASEHARQVRDNDSDRVSVGKVQREVKVGMTSSQVVAALGSPNIVTTDEERREQWVYDKIATESVYSTSSGGVGGLILAIPGSILGLASGSTSGSAGAKSTQQRTLTVIVKFDKEQKVRDLAYHNSSF